MTNRHRLRARHRRHKGRNKFRGQKLRLGLPGDMADVTLIDIVRSPRFAEQGKRAVKAGRIVDLFTTRNGLIEDVVFVPIP